MEARKDWASSWQISKTKQGGEDFQEWWGFFQNSKFSSSRSLFRQSSQIPGWCDSGGWRWSLQSNFQPRFNLHWTTPSKNALPEVNVFDMVHCWSLSNARDFLGKQSLNISLFLCSEFHHVASDNCLLFKEQAKRKWTFFPFQHPMWFTFFSNQLQFLGGKHKLYWFLVLLPRQRGFPCWAQF